MILPPYAASLGVRAGESGTLTMAFAYDLIGSPGRLHGGALAGLLEIAALAAVLDSVAPGTRLKPIGVTVTYMREGKPEDTHARGQILRLGRRVANVRAEAWQSDPGRLIAQAQLAILLEAPAVEENPPAA
jgi:uncharacterized protein (TIGR00369 family)